MDVIEIPLRTTEEVLVVNPEDLKEDETFLLDLLTEERIPAGIYIKISIEYWKQGLLEQFERFLKSGRSMASKLQGDKARAMLLSMLGLYYLEVIRLLNLGTEVIGGYTSKDISHLEQEVKKIHNEAISVGPNEVTTLLLQANLCRNSSTLDEALAAYNKASSLDPTCVPALLGEAYVYYSNGDYARALEKYQAALALDSNIDLNMRINMGICFYYLGMDKHALRSFQRILEISPENKVANLLVAAIEIQTYRNSTIPTETKQKMIAGIKERIYKAIENYPNSLFLKYLLTRIMLTREEFDKAYILSESVIAGITNNKRVHQQMLFCKSRCLQYQGKYRDAFRIISAAPSFETRTSAFESLLSQIYLEKGLTSKALSLLESVLRKTNNSYFPTLRYISVGLSQEILPKTHVSELLSMIKEQAGRIESSNSAERVFEPYILAKIASHNDVLDVQASLELYITAVGKMRAAGIDVPYTIYNNIGALSYKLVESFIGNVNYYGRDAPKDSTILRNEYFTKIDECIDNKLVDDLKELEHLFSHSKYVLSYLIQAEKCYICALSLVRENISVDSDEYSISEATIMINSALLKRSAGMLQSAHDICQKLLHKYPTYVDNRLLLSQIYLSWCELDDCYHHLRIATSIDVNNVTSRLLLANYHLERNNNYREAKRVYDSILRDINSNDAYALCALGNLNVKFVRGTNTKEQRNTYLDRALRLYNSALKKNTRNIYAALGIGIVLAEKGQLSTARTVFSQIEQPVTDNDSAAINLAQVNITADPHGSHMSIPLCRKSFIKKDGSYNIYALELLTRSYYANAKETKSVYHMKLALKYIQMVLLFSPKYLNFFNLALIKQQMSQILSEQPLEIRSLQELENELGKLDTAEQLFTALSKKTNTLKPKHIELAKLRASFCKDVRSQVLRKIRETAIIDEQRRERLEGIKKHQQRIENERSVKQIDEINRLTEEEQEIQRYRDELQQKVLHDVEKLARVEAKSQKSDDKKNESSKGTEKSAVAHPRYKSLSNSSAYASPDHMELRPVQEIDPEAVKERHSPFSRKRGLRPKSYAQTLGQDPYQKKQKLEEDTELHPDGT